MTDIKVNGAIVSEIKFEVLTGNRIRLVEFVRQSDGKRFKVRNLQLFFKAI